MNKRHLPPTDKELQVLYYIEDYLGTNKRSPTYKEIRVHCNLSSDAHAQYYVKQLLAKGELCKTKNKTRNLAIKKI